MKFIVDECSGSMLANWLMDEGYDTFSVIDQARGISDIEVLQIANREA